MRSNPLAGDEPAVLDALLLVARHLRAHRELPEPGRLKVDRFQRRVRCQLLAMSGWELGDLAAWADSLTESSVKVSRTAQGDLLVVTVLGCTADGVPLEVFGGQLYSERLFGPMTLGTARAVSSVELATAAARSASIMAEAARRRRPGGGGAR